MLTALDPLATRKLASGGLVAPPPPAVLSLPFGPDDTASASPLSLFTPPAGPPPPRRRRSILVTAGLTAAVALLIVLVATQGPPTPPLGPPAAVPAARRHDSGEDLEEMVKLAAEGDTVVDRQRAFDRLVALGYGDRVPWVPMLARDLVQLPTCEERREVVAKLRKINDPAVMPHLQKAAALPENECLAGEARAAIARLEGAPQPTPPPKKRSSRGGGHF